MARNRMFSGDVVKWENFRALPGDAQRLYFFLLLQADDDGFVGNPRGIADMWHIAPDCLRVLIAKRFVISFEAGCIVIRHWKKHNCISKRKYTPTVWQREFRQLVERDSFIEMPGDAQRLYFFLLLQADDDGFVGNPRGIADMWHIAPDCLRVLIAKRFVISFEAGCIVIRHWKLHNCISKRKYTPTVWQREFRQLVEVDGEYLLVNMEEVV